jgi:hypothetical protein
MKLFTVRNSHGDLIGRYRVTEAKYAVRRAKDEQALLASTFKKSHSLPRMDDWIATSEET